MANGFTSDHQCKFHRDVMPPWHDHARITPRGIFLGIACEMERAGQIFSRTSTPGIWMRNSRSSDDLILNIVLLFRRDNTVSFIKISPLIYREFILFIS